MPQITQLPLIFFSQLFWLAVVFGIIFFVIGRGMVPKIQATVDAREKKIADDLERRQAARAAADETEAAWRARMDTARADAARIAQEAKQASATKTEAKVRAAADKINAKVEAAEGQDPRRARRRARRDRGGRRRSDAGHGRTTDRHHGRQEGSRRRGEGGNACLSRRPPLVTEVPSARTKPEPTAFSALTAPWLIALAMLVVIAIMIWKKVPGAIGKALDDKIKLIRDQLAEAEDLRKEAEALKAEYETKSKSADKDAAALLERAKHEAEEIVAKAKTDAEALIERRTRMAEDKIAAEERVSDRATPRDRCRRCDKGGRAGSSPSATTPATDGKLVDQAIKEIAGR